MVTTSVPLRGQSNTPSAATKAITSTIVIATSTVRPPDGAPKSGTLGKVADGEGMVGTAGGGGGALPGKGMGADGGRGVGGRGTAEPPELESRAEAPPRRAEVGGGAPAAGGGALRKSARAASS